MHVTCIHFRCKVLQRPAPGPAQPATVLGRTVCHPSLLALAQARYEAAYVHVMSVLKYLLDPSSGTAGTPLPAESHLSAAERQAFLQTLLQAGAALMPYM